MGNTVKCLTVSMVLPFVIVGLVCTGCCNDSKSDTAYGLGRQAYSAGAQTAAVLAFNRVGSELSSYIVMADTGQGTAKWISPLITRNPLEAAWQPGKDTLVTTFHDGLGAFREWQTDGEYSGSWIACPLGYLYTGLTWSPDGTWLALRCFSKTSGGTPVVGFMKGIDGNSFHITTVPYGYDGRAAWLNDSTLRVPHDGMLRDVRIEHGQPVLVGDAGAFEGLYCGNIGDKPVTRSGRTLRIGDQEFVTASADGYWSLAITDRYVFASGSPTDLSVFDKDARLVCTTRLDHKLMLGAAGEDASTVYGIAGRDLIRVSLRGGAIELSSVAALDNLWDTGVSYNRKNKGSGTVSSSSLTGAGLSDSPSPD